MNAKDKMSDRALFAECCNGFGFEELEQSPDGLYCQGCLQVHKRPTKMYSYDPRGPKFGKGNQLGSCLCQYQVIRLFNPRDQ